MKYSNIKEILVMTLSLLSIVLTSSCEDAEKSHSDLDLSLLCISQSRTVWDGVECNVEKTLKNRDINDISYDLTINLYQNKKADRNATVDIVVDQDSLAKLMDRANEGGVYSKYENAIPVKESYYELSANRLTLNSGEVVSASVRVTIFTNKLLADPMAGDNENAFFALPIKIRNSTAYKINDRVASLMLMVHLPQIDPTVSDPREPKQEISGMKLAWNDEFNGTGAPDPEKWVAEQGFKRNNELQWYQGQNAQCENGTLVIMGKVERVKNPNYDAASTDWKKKREYAEYTSSSFITKKYVFRQGRMLVRAKIPTEMGVWPAIWTTGKEINKTTGETNSGTWEWPLGGEIDLLECYLKNGKPHIHANACWGTDTRWSAKWDSYNRPLDNFTAIDAKWTEKYHIWRMDWDNKYIRLYLDDELLNEIDLSQTYNGSGGLKDEWKGSWRNPFTDEGNEGYLLGQQMFLNLALGANGGTPDQSKFPVKYYVDYIRIYQY